MAEARNSNFAMFSLIMTSVMLGMNSGYQFVVYNPLTPILQRIYNESYQSRYDTPLPDSTWVSLLSISISSVSVGGMIGAIFAPPVLLLISRKKLMQMLHVFNYIAIILTAVIGKVTSSYEVIIFGRIVAGVPIGALYVLTPIMVAEMSARRKLGFWLSTIGCSFGGGVFLGVVFSHPKIFGSYELWPCAIALGGIPSTVYLISSYWLPNTPFYMMRQRNKDETMKILAKMRLGDQADLELEYKAMQAELQGSKILPLMKILKTKQYRNHFIAVLCLNANLMLCGINNFGLYSDRIFLRAGISVEYVTLATIGVFGLQFFASLFGTKLVDSFGARRMLIAASCFQISALCLFLACQATLHLAPTVLPYLFIVAMLIFFVPFSSGTNLAIPALSGSVTIEPTRPTCLGIGSILLWFSSWFVGFIPPFMEVGAISYSLCVWLVLNIGFLIYFIAKLPETKGKSVEEIQAKYK